jgi:hypothetical protein
MPMQGVHAVHAHAGHAHAVRARVMYAHAVHCMYVRVHSDMPTVTICRAESVYSNSGMPIQLLKFSITAKVAMTLKTNSAMPPC